MNPTLPKAPAHYDQAQMQKILEQIERAIGVCIKVGDDIVIRAAGNVVGAGGNVLKFQAPNGTLYKETVDNTGTPSFT